MSIANPAALWLLSLIPVIVLIHSLKPKPRRLEVSSLFLLEAALSEKGGGLSLRKILLNNLPLILQILIILAAVTGLADPVREVREKTTADMVVVIDTSASMNARASVGTRLDMAKKTVQKLIGNLSENRKMIIIDAGQKPLLKSGFSSDKTMLGEAVDSIYAKEVAGDLEKSVFLALSFLDAEKQDMLHLVTDTAGAPMDRISALYPYITVTKVEGGRDNVGITRFEFRSELMADDRFQIFLAIKNFNPEPVDVPVQMTIDNTVVANFRYELSPGEERRFLYPYRGLIAGTAKVTIDRPDDLEADNKAYAVLSNSSDIWVLLVSRGNFFLEQILAAYPNVKVSRIDRIIHSSWPQQVRSNDIVIIDNMDFPPVEEGNFLLINSFSPAIPIRRTGMVDRPVVTDWNRQHPVTRQVNLEALAIKKASALKGNDEIQPLILSANTGLLFAYRKDRFKAVFFGFDPAESDLPYRVAFPVLMSNIMNWLYPDKLTRSSAQVKSGDTIEIELDSRIKQVRMRNPAGKWEHHVVETTPFFFQDTTAVGLYTMLAGNKRKYFAVNLLSPLESDINAVSTDYKPETNQGLRPGADRTIRKSFWLYLLLAVATVLFVEWYAWLRTK